MTSFEQPHVEIVAKMLRAKVVKSHHKQKASIINWCSGYDGDVLKQAIDDLVRDPTAPVFEKGRGTITLSSIHEAKDFIEEYDDEDEYTWYL